MSSLLPFGRPAIDGKDVLLETALRGGGTTVMNVTQEVMSNPSGAADLTSPIGLPVRAVIVVNHALTGSASSGDADGVTLVDGDLVLAAAQTVENQRRVYTYNSSGAWAAAANYTYASGQLVYIEEGTLYGKRFGMMRQAPDSTLFEWGFLPRTSRTASYLQKANAAGDMVDSQIYDDGSFVKVNTSSTSGLVNIGRSHASAAALNVENTSSGAGTGVGIFASAANTSGVGIQGYATGATAFGVVGIGAGSTGVGVRGESATGRGGEFERTGNGLALYVSGNVNGATAILSEFAQRHSGSTSTTIYAWNAGAGKVIDVAAAGGVGLTVAQTGNVQCAYFSRNVAPATQSVLEVAQLSTTNNQYALKVTDAGTNGAASFVATAGRAAFFHSTDNVSVYAFRSSNPSTASAVVHVWAQNGSDANPALIVDHSGTGKGISVRFASTEKFAVEPGGVIATEGSGWRRNVVSKSANYTITKSDDIILALTSTASASFTLTLPTPVAGMVFEIWDVENNGGTKTVTLARAGSEKIDGATSNKTVINANGEKVTVVCDGTDWFTRVANTA